MILFPAIDLKGGKCVRLLKGDFDTATVYNDNPAAQARLFESAGCEWVHIVDLDGAASGQMLNAGSIQSIVEATSVELQLGGGIRSRSAIEFWLGRGVRRVILGTAAIENESMVASAAREFPGRVAVGIDARNGIASSRGWLTETGIAAKDIALRFEDCGVAAIIYTDIDRDGTMLGVNVEATAEIARSVSIPVIASGGISSLANLKSLANCGETIHGAIVGRAIYDGSIDLSEALNCIRH